MVYYLFSQSSTEALIAATAYLDLFLRSITDSNLMKVFLQFIMVERSDGRPILGLLVSRIAEESQVSYTLKTSDIFGMFGFFVIISFYKLSYQVQHSNCSAKLPPSLPSLSSCLSVRLRIRLFLAKRPKEHIF